MGAPVRATAARQRAHGKAGSAKAESRQKKWREARRPAEAGIASSGRVREDVLRWQETATGMGMLQFSRYGMGEIERGHVQPTAGGGRRRNPTSNSGNPLWQRQKRLSRENDAGSPAVEQALRSQGEELSSPLKNKYVAREVRSCCVTVRRPIPLKIR